MRFFSATRSISITSGSKAKTPENRNRRTPPLDSVLKEELARDYGDPEPSPNNRSTERRTGKCENGGICFKQSLDVPLFV